MSAAPRARVFVLPLVAAAGFAAGRVTAHPNDAKAPPPVAAPPAPDVARNDPHSPAPPPASTSAAAVPNPSDMRSSVAPLVERVKASVVAIHSTKIIRRVVREDPFSQFLRERMGLPEPQVQRETQQSLGSGFIIDDKGTVLTNNHVVAGADEVEVQLDDDRVLPASVVGSDPLTDVAVVAIKNPPKDLRPAKLGDSERLRVGDYVLAIGNPLGLGQTVTMGIVSAKNRSLGARLGEVEPRFQDFIQTDAAINQGNSGGPLFDFAGEVVGINSAILNPAVAMNVGFAIPINLARRIADQLQKNKRVVRGYLGVGTDDVPPERAASLGVAPGQGGAIVNVVEQGSPADRAGLRPNDVIVEIGGRRVDHNRLSQIIAQLGPGDTAKIVFLRGGKRVETQAILSENRQFSGEELAVLRIRVRPLTEGEARYRGLAPGQGLVVVGVDPRGPSSGEIAEGDVLLGVGRQPATVQVMRAFEQLLERGGAGRLVIQRGRQQIVVTLSG